MPTRAPHPWHGTPALLRTHWRKALSLARILFEEEGYHTRYLQEIEAFIGTTTATAPARHGQGRAAPHALDADTKARVARLAERMGSLTSWCTDPQDPRWGTEEDLGHVYEEVRQLVATDPQAAAALFAAYAPKREREVLSPPAADTAGDASAPVTPPVPDASRYRIDHYPHSRFWAVYAGEELVAVTVYRKGARAIVDRLDAQERTIADLKRQMGHCPALG